jgi:hypothetical protein
MSSGCAMLCHPTGEITGEKGGKKEKEEKERC